MDQKLHSIVMFQTTHVSLIICDNVIIAIMWYGTVADVFNKKIV